MTKYLPGASVFARPPAGCGRTIALALVAAAALVACGNQDHGAAGREFLAKGDYASAAVSLRNALQQDPGSVEARVMMAEVLERRHDRPGAEEQLRKAVEYGGNADELVPRIALMMVDRGDMDAVIRSYKDLRLKDPDADATLRGIVALAMLTLRREAPARQQIEGAPAVPAVRLARAQLLANEGRAKEALAALELDKADSPPPWWLLRAARRIAVAAGEPELSLDLMRRAQEAVPWNLGVVGEYGEALISDGRFDEATKVRDRLAKTAPQFFWTHYLSALLYNHAGRIDEAHAAALTVLKVSPDHVGSSLMAASAELRRGDLVVAEQRLSTLARKNPELVPALRLLAQAQLRLGHREDAVATLRRGLNLVPGDPELLMLRARVEADSGRPKEAAATYAEVAARHPDEPELQLSLAQARAAAGDRAGARQALERAQAMVKDGGQGARVVETLLGMRDVDSARRFADELVARFPKDDQARLAQAATKSAQGDAAGAWAATLAVLDDKPVHAGALAALAAMSRTPDQRKELLARHAKALEAGGGGPGQLLDYAVLLRLEPAGAQTPLSVLDLAVQRYPASVPVRAALIEELLRAGDAARALSIAESGAAAANASAQARELLGGTYLRLGKPQQATEVFRKLANEFPQRADWRFKLAQLEAENGRVAEATSLLRSLVSERPFDPAPYSLLAQLAAKSNIDEALSVARQLGTQPEFKAASLLLVGDIYMVAGKPNEALEQFGAAVKAGAVPTAQLRIVDVLDHTGKRSSADQEMAEVMRRYPEQAAVLAFAARRAQLAGDPDKAVDYLQRLARKTPNDPILLNDLAWAQLAAGRPEALANARKALVAMPNDPNVLHTVGLALAKSGKREEAIVALRASANLAPTRATPKLHLAEALSAAGDKAGAVAALRGVDETQLGPKDREDLGKLKGTLGLS